MPDPENCGAIMTSCPACRHAFELPELHYRICKLASERDAARTQVAALAGLLTRWLDVHQAMSQPHYNGCGFTIVAENTKSALAAAGEK